MLAETPKKIARRIFAHVREIERQSKIADALRADRAVGLTNEELGDLARETEAALLAPERKRAGRTNS